MTKRVFAMAATMVTLAGCGLDKQHTPQLSGPSVLQTPNGAPVARFSFSPTTPGLGETIVFDASASTDDGQIVSFVWQFSDGPAFSGARVTRAYAEQGTFVVRLTVTDDRGIASTVSSAFAVTNAAPTASFTISPTDPVVGTPVHFNGQASTPRPGETITSYDWDFGDGTTHGTGVETDHVYTLVRTYTVVLTVRDNTGHQAVTSKTIAVK